MVPALPLPTCKILATKAWRISGSFASGQIFEATSRFICSSRRDRRRDQSLDRHRNTAVTSLIPTLSCRSCRPNAPFAELVRLSRTRVCGRDARGASAAGVGRIEAATRLPLLPQEPTFFRSAVTVVMGQNRTFDGLLPTQLVSRVCVGRSDGGGKPLGASTRSRRHPKSFWSAAKRFT